MIRENLKYNNSIHGLNGPPTPENVPAEEDFGFESGQQPAGPVRPSRKVNAGRKAVQEFLGGDYLTRDWVVGNITYILYVALLAMIYIANTYYSEKKFKDIERTKSELKELRYRYITTKSILMFHERQSEISRHATVLGLHEAKMPPYKVLYSEGMLREKEKQQP